MANNLSPEDLAYYAQQQQAIRSTQAIGQKELQNAEAGANLTYSQKIAALQEKLTQQQNALPDRFAARGIQNSGIYSYGGGGKQYTGQLGNGGFTQYRGLAGGQLGALQQFKFDSNQALSDLRNQQINVDQGYTDKLADLNTTANNQLQGINATEASQNAAQAALDAVQAG